MKLSECQDNQTLIAALSRLWASRPAGAEFEHPYFIGVHLNGLVPDRLHSLNLFDGTEDEQSRTRLLAAMDAAEQQIWHEHAGSGDHADRVQGRAHADCVSQHSGPVLKSGQSNLRSFSR